ncbi:ATP12 like protein [Babesia gibsoni]|uniref:ATP12 like protein n=1 Tax=Babesia gibsoni TaxID=33632 RepID=A0AAD8PF18_BABGI|nr:ATP12 like protein [Babesia gibsoni]
MAYFGKRWNLVGTISGFNRQCTRLFGQGCVQGVYKRVRLCDKPAYSLCRKSAELLRQDSNILLLLDGNLLESPLGNVICTTSSTLGEGILSEWRAQLGKLTRFDTLPITMLVAETIDRRPAEREKIVNTLIDSIKFDTVLRFDMSPVVELPPLENLDNIKLSQIDSLDIDVLQSSYLKPILDGFSKRRGTSPLVTSASIASYPSQPPDVYQAIERSIHNLSEEEITTIWKLHRSLKSVILPLELMEGVIGATQALRAARLEETLQAARWGISQDFKHTESSILQKINVSLFFYRSHKDIHSH